MLEFAVPAKLHLPLPLDPSELLALAVGMLGDAAADLAADRDTDDQGDLQFSARFFETFSLAALAKADDPLVRLLAAAAHFLRDMPGTAQLIARTLGAPDLELGGGGLERWLHWLLAGTLEEAPLVTGWNASRVEEICDATRAFFVGLTPEDGSRALAIALRRDIYSSGAARELLLVDVACAVSSLRTRNSARRGLPAYSGLPLAAWEPALARPGFSPLLWPAQRLIGEGGVLSGASAVIQLPTSAGKTRAIEFAIRAAFLSGRATTVVVIAPFRSLTHELRETLEDALDPDDVTVTELTQTHEPARAPETTTRGSSVLVATPEKYLYMLRQEPALAATVGLLVLDEAHQFDEGARGVTYELLIATLLSALPATTQRLVISAVLQNAAAMSSWAIGNAEATVSASGLRTSRSVAIVEWRKMGIDLHFARVGGEGDESFAVPGVVKSVNVPLQGKERNKRRFPEKDDPSSVALSLALKLCREGGAAVFCGTKSSARGVCTLAVDILTRLPKVPRPSDGCHPLELAKLADSYDRNLGKEAAISAAARLGVLCHHGNVPHGVRYALEFAMRAKHCNLVVCTSTLAQGVNLPIRYLVVGSVRQAGMPMKIRDLRNLMGRAGRAGMHREGTVIFSDPKWWRAKGVWKARDRQTIKDALDESIQHACGSSILRLFDPIVSDDGIAEMPMDVTDILGLHVEAARQGVDWVVPAALRMAMEGFSADELVRQLSERRDVLEKIESFLLSHWHFNPELPLDTALDDLAQRTWAYHIGTISQRALLTDVFDRLARSVETLVPEAATRHYLGKTLMGLAKARATMRWVEENEVALLRCETPMQLMLLAWQVFASFAGNRTFVRWRAGLALQEACSGWIEGVSFGEIWQSAAAAQSRVGLGKAPHHVTVDHVVDLCESGFGFDFAHVVGAIADLASPRPALALVIEPLRALQRRLRYGLPDETAVLLYEMGYCDRPLALELAALAVGAQRRGDLLRQLEAHADSVQGIISNYPACFEEVTRRPADARRGPQTPG